MPKGEEPYGRVRLIMYFNCFADTRNESEEVTSWKRKQKYLSMLRLY